MTADRKSLNRAFWDLGLRFQWDEATWSGLASMPDLRSQLAFYLENHQPHLLAVYDVDSCVTSSSSASPLRSIRAGLEAHRS